MDLVNGKSKSKETASKFNHKSELLLANPKLANKHYNLLIALFILHNSHSRLLLSYHSFFVDILVGQPA